MRVATRTSSFWRQRKWAFSSRGTEGSNPPFPQGLAEGLLTEAVLKGLGGCNRATRSFDGGDLPSRGNRGSIVNVVMLARDTSN